MSSVTSNQSVRGINWGAVTVSDSGSTLDMCSLGDGANVLMSVPLGDIQAVSGTRVEVQLQMKIPPKSSGIRMKSMKLAVPSPCVGFEQSAEAGKEMQAVIKSAVEAAGGGGGIGQLAAAVSANHGATIAKMSNVTILQPNGVFNVTWTESALVLLESKRMLTAVVPASDIVRMFLLQVPNSTKRYLSIVLRNALRLGNVEVNNVVMSFDDSRDVAPAESPVLLDEECPPATATAFGALTEASGGVEVGGRKGMHGELANIASSLSKVIFQVPLTGDNTDILQVQRRESSGNAVTAERCVIRCSLKASEGHLYILKKFLMFLHRPATFIPYSDIKEIRVNTEGIVATFIMEVFVLREGKVEKVQFTGIEKAYLHPILDYFKKAASEQQLQLNVKIIGDAEEESEDEVPEDDEETDDSYKTGDDSDYSSDDDSDASKKKPKKEKSDKKSKKDKSDKKSKKDKSDKKSKKDKSDKKSKKDKSDKKSKKDKKAGDKRDRE